ncbi:MAG: sigma-70 family RNA polymerase sigma factor [Tepidisphaeraceae bacterium]
MVRLIHQPTGGADLLEQYRQSGSPDIFAQIMCAYGGMVLSVCYKVTKDSADAEDASQAVFLTLAVQCKTGAPIQYLGPWLKKVAKRTALDLIRSKKRRTRRETVTAENRPEHYDVRPGAKPEADELSAILRAELDELPSKYRMPLVLHYFGGLSHEQISNEMKCTTAALGVRLHRARKMLAKRLTARGISLEGAALGAALAVAVPTVFSERFIRSTQAAVMGLHFAQPMMTAGLPDNFAAVLSLVSQVGHSMAKQRLKMATAVMAASITLLGGAAEATRFLPDSLRPTLEFLAPSTLIKNLLTPNLPVPRLQSETKTKTVVATLEAPDSAYTITPPVYTGGTPSFARAAANQPVLALQVSEPMFMPAPQTTAALALPSLTQASAAIQSRSMSLPAITSLTVPVGENPRQTSQLDAGFHPSSSGSTVAAVTEKASTLAEGTTSGDAGGRRLGPPIAPPPGELALASTSTQNIPEVRPVGGFEFAAVGGATHNRIPVIQPGILGRIAGPAQVPADATFVPSSIVMHHGDVYVPGDGSYSWSDRLTGVDAGGANSVDFTLTGVQTGGGVLAIERVPVTSTVAPERPTGHHFVGIWAITADFSYDSITLTPYYDVAFAESLGLPENVLKLWVYDPAKADWIRIMDDSFSRDLVAHTVTGTYADGTPTFFAVSAPNRPSSASSPSPAACSCAAGGGEFWSPLPLRERVRVRGPPRH